jgi:transglutaminase-like putative cysteine protease
MAARLVLACALVTAPACRARGAEGDERPTKVGETWDAIYIGGSKVGYTLLQVERAPFRGKTYFRIKYKTVLNFERNGDPITVEQVYGTIETPDGRVLRLDTRALVGEKQIRTYGDVIDGKMLLKLAAGDQEQSKEVDWPADVLGPYGAELSMSRKPLRAGETREVRTFIPDLNEICTARLEAKQVEQVVLGDGRARPLLRVEFTGRHPDGKPEPALKQTVWVDETGQILKSHADVWGGMDFYRTTKKAATEANKGPAFDQVKATIVKVRDPLTRPDQRRQVVYRITLKGDGDPAESFPADRRQTVVRKEGDRSIVLDVRTAGPDVGAAGPERVDAQYLRANPMIDGNDSRVIRLAREATRGAVGPWDQAVAIERWVAENLKKKDYKTAFATASEVAQNLTGDCTEHSVLVAAMCRASGIPSRVAAGLVYAPPQHGFGYHMWNEVYVNRRWVALDATFEQADVDATHIKILDTSLDGVTPLESLLKIVYVCNNLAIDVLEVR